MPERASPPGAATSTTTCGASKHTFCVTQVTLRRHCDRVSTARSWGATTCWHPRADAAEPFVLEPRVVGLYPQQPTRSHCDQVAKPRPEEARNVRVDVVIPAHDEEGRIDHTLARYRRASFE